SSTVENHFAVSRQPLVLLLQFLGIHVHRAGDDLGLRFKVHGMAKIHDNEIVAGIDLFLQLLDTDAGDAQLAEKLLAAIELVPDVAGECTEKNSAQAAAQGSCPLRDMLDLIAEDIAGSE